LNYYFKLQTKTNQTGVRAQLTAFLQFQTRSFEQLDLTHYAKLNQFDLGLRERNPEPNPISFSR